MFSSYLPSDLLCIYSVCISPGIHCSFTSVLERSMHICACRWLPVLSISWFPLQSALGQRQPPTEGCWWECRDCFVWNRVRLSLCSIYAGEQGAGFPSSFQECSANMSHEPSKWQEYSFDQQGHKSGHPRGCSLLLQSAGRLQSNSSLTVGL